MVSTAAIRSPACLTFEFSTGYRLRERRLDRGPALAEGCPMNAWSTDGTPQPAREVPHRLDGPPPAGPSELLTLLYGELRALAAARLRHERPDHTLQPTELVNEAYMRLVAQTRVQWQGRAHFMAIASEVVRRVLVDHARARCAAKRGGGATRLSLDVGCIAPGATSTRGIDYLDLHAALNELASLDPRQARVVELRFFGSLSVAEMAGELGVSERTVKEDWRIARAWLRGRLSAGSGS